MVAETVKPTDRHQKPKLVEISDILNTRNPLINVIKAPAERVLGLRRINKGYANAQQRHGSQGLANDFFTHICNEFKMNYSTDLNALQKIPKKGPVVILSNHPYGLADGMLLGKLLTSVRRDVKLVANDQLDICEEIRPWLITVDPFDTMDAKRKNLQGMRQMLKTLRSGGMLGIFPAGSASSYSMKDKCVIDTEWNDNIASLIRKTNATVVTVHFPGRNSLLFQGMSLVKKEARAVLLPRELKRSVKQNVRLEVSSPISSHSLKKFTSDREMIDYLKLITYCQGRKAKETLPASTNNTVRTMETIIAPLDPQLLYAEVQQLPQSAKLKESGDFSVYIANAQQIPHLLKEIGRLRETTFREVGEGTGRSFDIDTYDSYYKQLFLWDHKANKLVGGYRIGETDKIIRQKGIKGLYNSKFFDFQPEVFEKINLGLEMGRSFIIKEYQRKPLMLGLIWQGIGQFISANPEYRYLFGVVSTSAKYNSYSFKLIADFLKQHSMDEELASMIKAKNPMKGNALKPSELESMINAQLTEQHLSDLVSHIESDKKGIPVLLRQYLKLNGKILGFNIDNDFGGVLDCMILVDLHKSPKRSMQKYLGKDAVEKMLAYGLIAFE